MAQSLASGALGGAAGFRVVPLSAADAPAYRALMLHAYESAADAFTSTPQERAAAPLSWWLERIAGAEGRSQVVGAFADQVLVGALTLECATQAKTRHKAHLAGMFVAPSARGQGVGRALMQAAMGLAAERPGLQVVTLTATEGNAAAIALYSAFGFRIFGVEPMAIAVPGGFKAKVHMWVALPLG